jgi:hypothetical protein
MGGYHVQDSLVRTLLRPCRSTGVHDDLVAYVLVLDDGERALALVTVDLMALFHDDVLAIRKLAVEGTGLPSLESIVATHTQAGPDMYGIYGGVPQRYRAFVHWWTAEAIVRAVARRVPARLGFATTQVEGLVGNRRDAQGPVDPELTIMVVEDETGALGDLHPLQTIRDPRGELGLRTFQ